MTRNKGEDRLSLAITKQGKQRIREMLPTYKTERPWDNHIYLISYDIPKIANRSRDVLREYIKRTGGALLQESLWINPYNPTLLLESFTRHRDIPGTILVSKLGTDGAIGGETLAELISRVYKLDVLQEAYEEFLETYRRSSGTPKRKLLWIILLFSSAIPSSFPLEPKISRERSYTRYSPS